MFKKFFNFRLDERTQAELQTLAHSQHRTQSNLVRHLIHIEFAKHNLSARASQEKSQLKDVLVAGDYQEHLDGRLEK